MAVIGQCPVCNKSGCFRDGTRDFYCEEHDPTGNMKREREERELQRVIDVARLKYNLEAGDACRAAGYTIEQLQGGVVQENRRAELTKENYAKQN